MIVDRLANFFKLPNGEFVAIEKLEDLYGRIPIIQQIYVAGISSKDSLVALIVPDKEPLQRMMPKAYAELPWKELCKHRATENFLERLLEEYSDKHGLTKFERLAKFTVLAEPFSAENGMLTPTQKLQRKAIFKKYLGVIEDMYV